MDYANVDIKKQINSMIFLNVMSYSVLSGCGNCSTLSENEYDELDDLLQDVAPEQRPYNLFFTESLYKKGLPQYAQEPGDPYNFEGFKWIKNKQKKEIRIEVMASSIIACCSLIERVLTFELRPEKPELLIYILHKTASKQAKFIQKYLKVGSIFYNGEDTSNPEDNGVQVQITSKNPDIHTQFAVMHAFSCLAQLHSYHLNYLSCDEDYFHEDLNSLPKLLNSFKEHVEAYSSKVLSLSGLHLIEMYLNNPYHREEISKVLKILAKELCQRISEDGLLRGSRSVEEVSKPVSAYTTISCLNTLSKLAFIFSSKSCYEASQKLYKQFSAFWDNDGRIFRLKDSNKQSYKTKLIFAILAALFSFSRITHEANQQEELTEQIVTFADTAMLKSGIFNSQYYPILQNNKIEHLLAKNSKKSWAPVFNKAFEYKISKRKYYCDADVYKADDVMPACVVLITSISN